MNAAIGDAGESLTTPPTAQTLTDRLAQAKISYKSLVEQLYKSVWLENEHEALESRLGLLSWAARKSALRLRDS